jgi:hypothetical protein
LVADIVVLNDNRKMNLIKRIVGDDRDHLMDVCDKMIFFCQMDRPALAYKRILLICPQFAEVESSFVMWAERMLRLAKELGLHIDMYGTDSTFERWEKIAEFNKYGGNTKLIRLDEIDDFFLVNERKDESDLIVCCAARKGGVSHSPAIDGLPTKLEKAFPENDTIIIYPSQKIVDSVFSKYEDFDSNAISLGMEKINQIGKEVKNIFKN